MLTHLTQDTIDNICQLAQARHAVDGGTRELTFPSNSANLVAAALSGPSPEYQALVNKLLSLPKEEITELGALMFLGRQDGGTFKDTLQHAKNSLDANAPYYIAQKLPLADYLKKGLIKMANE